MQIIKIFFISICSFSVLYCETFTRAASGPLTIEYSKWSIESEIVMAVASKLYIDDVVFLWPEEPFSYDVKEITIRLEDVGPYINIDLGLSDKAFGKDFYTPGVVSNLTYGIAYVNVDAGVNLIFGVFDYATLTFSPYLGASRHRNGVFVYGFKSIFREIRSSPEFLERHGTYNLPHIFWDYSRVGLAVCLNMKFVSLRGDVFWCPYTDPSVINYDITKASPAISQEPPSAYGLGYKVMAKICMNPFYIAFGSAWYKVAADVAMPIDYADPDYTKVVAGTLSQNSKGFFFSLGFSF